MLRGFRVTPMALTGRDGAPFDKALPITVDQSDILPRFPPFRWLVAYSARARREHRDY
jgi:hypothetical protein